MTSWLTLKSNLTLYSVPSFIETGFFLICSFLPSNSAKLNTIGSGRVADSSERLMNSICVLCVMRGICQMDTNDTNLWAIFIRSACTNTKGSFPSEAGGLECIKLQKPDKLVQ